MTLEIVQGLLHKSPWIVSSKCVEKLREVGEHTVVSYTVLQTLLPGTNTVGHYTATMFQESSHHPNKRAATENERARIVSDYIFRHQINEKF